MNIIKLGKFWLSLLVFFLIVSYNYVPTLAQNAFSNSSQLLTQQTTTEKIIATGTEVIINENRYTLPWLQWEENQQLHFGLSDTRAEAILGIELLSTDQPTIQPVHWFYYNEQLPAKFVNPYRYLDITKLAQVAKINLTIEDNRLKIDFSPAQLKKVYQPSSSSNQQIIVELDRPAFWQFSQGSKQGILKIEGQANPQLIEQFTIQKPTDSQIQEEEGELPSGTDKKPESEPLFTIENSKNQAVIIVNIPPGNNLKVTSSNPNYLFIDIQPGAMVPRQITWHPDLVLRQNYVTLPAEINTQQSDSFFVSYLTLNLKKFNLDLQPITTGNNTIIGTAPLTTTAQKTGAIVAINGGFFNRNNQLPLGAIKSKQKWLSGPILNRGAIAWDEVGNIKIGRLKLQESLTTSNGDFLPINHLNSGYIQAGISRYTPEWGLNYTTISDNEIIVLVEKDTVKEHIIAKKSGEDSITIPNNGYLLTIRNSPDLVQKLSPNTTIKLDSYTIPNEFNNYPNIIGAGPLLLLDNKIVLNGEAENFSKAFNLQKASRSGIAITRDNQLLLVAVHQRIGGAGPSLLEFAKILQNLGAVNALNLDGGSSTQIYLGGQIIDRSPATAAKVHNGIGVFLN
jgi:hypothetical protein